MSAEQKIVRLRGIHADLKKYTSLKEIEYPDYIVEIGDRIADKLNRFAPMINSENLSNGFVFWDFNGSETFDGNHEEEEQFGLYLECGDFYVDKIYFVKDGANNDAYSLCIHGCSNFESDLFNYPDSELQVLFFRKDDKLVFNEVLLLGFRGHDMFVSQLEINDLTKLKIMSIADRAMNIFTRMESVKDVSILQPTY